MYNNNGAQPSQGGHLAGYNEAMARVAAEVNAERQAAFGYQSGIAAGHEAGYQEGHNAGRLSGWNQAVRLGNEELEGQKDITRQVATQRDALQAEVNRQRQLIAQLEARLDAERAAATKTIAQWKTYSEGLKTQRDQVQQKFDALQGVLTQLRATTSRIETQLSVMTEDRNKAASDHAQQLWLHQRGLVFIDTVRNVLETLTGDECPYAEEVRDMFSSAWQEEVQRAIEAGHMKESPIHDPSFVLAYPQTGQLIVEMLQRAGQQYNPEPEATEDFLP